MSRCSCHPSTEVTDRLDHNLSASDNIGHSQTSNRSWNDIDDNVGVVNCGMVNWCHVVDSTAICNDARVHRLQSSGHVAGTRHHSYKLKPAAATSHQSKLHHCSAPLSTPTRLFFENGYHSSLPRFIRVYFAARISCNLSSHSNESVMYGAVDDTRQDMKGAGQAGTA